MGGGAGTFIECNPLRVIQARDPGTPVTGVGWRSVGDARHSASTDGLDRFRGVRGCCLGRFHQIEEVDLAGSVESVGEGCLGRFRGDSWGGGGVVLAGSVESVGGGCLGRFRRVSRRGLSWQVP